MSLHNPQMRAGHSDTYRSRRRRVARVREITGAAVALSIAVVLAAIGIVIGRASLLWWPL